MALGHGGRKASDCLVRDCLLPTGGGELLMQDGVTSPPVPLETEDGSDWLYTG